ncbi:hypothetical protein SH1V18_34590 [Vallitalea longa]|uniref:DUF4234 domain-containing protein n=1 Tax=Vallitalea longa TaxID=2936439 RepID=A0A9W6DHL3_9FIRM|nr:DUF4234 domain-containing protein [Vallitalea longa]GKX30979.1 hypothetical protein SH1V18_34590 [Vallitalea longa]
MKRNILLTIILSFITFGIYLVYWMYKVNNESNKLANGDYQTESIIVILFTIITFGIYGLYWGYKQGKNYCLITGSEFPPVIFMIFVPTSGFLIPTILLQVAINDKY